MSLGFARAFALGALVLLPAGAAAQSTPTAARNATAPPGSGAAITHSPRPLLPIEFENSAEFRWLNKPVLDRRTLDDVGEPGTWRLHGTAELSFPDDRTGPSGMRVLRVDMEMFHDEPAPTRTRLSSATLRRSFPGEDWSGFNRISLWIRPDIAGFPMLPLQIVLHNEGRDTLPDGYHREGTHYVMLKNGVWQQVLWEIESLPRDRVTGISIGYWVNKMLAAPGDRVAFEVAGLELQRVEPDHYLGWDVAPGRIAYSHSGYLPEASKTAIASDLEATSFDVIRVDDTALGGVVFTGPVRTVSSRLGRYQVLDFSAVREPGRYILRAGDRHTRPFTIGNDAWRSSIVKALNFFYGERCGFHIFDSHGVDHRDWLATHGDQAIVMNGGWHDAGDLSQGMVNTGEATYAMFALAESLEERGEDPELVERLIEEATWGLDWVLRVRFDGGYRIGFASNNLWTNGIIGDADDRTREALNNPNVNYIAAAAGAIAARVLKDRDPALAARALRTAEDDWRHAITGVEGPETWSTPAYLAYPVELSGIGILASLELYQATGKEKYAAKAVELARTIVESQQKRYVGTDFPLAGFFWTGPDQDTLFHQFHRGNDQAPIVALAKLIDAFPDHPEWMDWYATVALYAEYQKTTARTTEPYGVLPAYVYRDTDHLRMPETLKRYHATPEAYREQVLQGMPMGDGWYLRAFPVWFSRRGNYGVLLSQAKALATAARVRRDAEAAELAQKQAQWVVGRNPFAQSTMYGEGYDWTQQYSVSSGDFVGALPVGMQSRGATDLPYWPPQNMYVYKEVWVHPVARWIWLMEELTAPMGAAERGPVLAATVSTPDFQIETVSEADGRVTIRLAATGEGTHTFALRTHNLAVDEPTKSVTLRTHESKRLEWRARVRTKDAPWVAVVIPNGDVAARLEAAGTAHPGVRMAARR